MVKPWDEEEKLPGPSCWGVLAGTTPHYRPFGFQTGHPDRRVLVADSVFGFTFDLLQDSCKQVCIQLGGGVPKPQVLDSVSLCHLGSLQLTNAIHVQDFAAIFVE